MFWEILLGLAWLSFEGPDLGLAPERRAKSLAPVSSDLRTDKKGLALVFPFHSCLAADFSMPGAPGHVSNLET